MTKGEAQQLARRARRYGHYRVNDTETYVHCPLCKVKCTAVKLPWEKLKVAMLDRAVVEHLLDEYGDGRFVCEGRKPVEARDHGHPGEAQHGAAAAVGAVDRAPQRRGDPAR